jgi:hypothetical protein
MVPGTSCTVQVTFTPTATGARSGTLSFIPLATRGPASPRQTIALVGTGLATSLGFSGSLQFGGVSLGDSAEQSITVINQSAVTVNIASVAVSGGSGAFGIDSDGCSGAALGPGQSCTVFVGFIPAKRGSVAGQLLINDNGFPTQQSVPISGTGTCAGRLCY